MAESGVVLQTPEERELNKKRAELTALEAELAQQELELATLQGELRAFERRYLRAVGARYAALDELQAQIAEAHTRVNPKDARAQRQAAQARAQADETAQTTESIDARKQAAEFKPSDSLRQLYREIARRIHPDLATDHKERARRTELMARGNRAYEDGDEAGLRAILLEWESSPESVKGEGHGAELVRVIRKIAQVEERLRTIEAEMARLKASELYQLMTKVREAEGEGRDLLTEMASIVDQEIAAAEGRLAKPGRGAGGV